MPFRRGNTCPYDSWYKYGKKMKIGMSAKLKKQIKESSTEYWINYNYKFKEEWLDSDEEQDSFGIQGGYIYMGKTHY